MGEEMEKRKQKYNIESIRFSTLLAVFCPQSDVWQLTSMSQLASKVYRQHCLCPRLQGSFLIHSIGTSQDGQLSRGVGLQTQAFLSFNSFLPGRHRHSRRSWKELDHLRVRKGSPTPATSTQASSPWSLTFSSLCTRFNL